ncbi:hypothetical protein MMC22_007327 [Lobaria immixta]|nr:hypothetical protein [Lobaria immixta]
MSIASLLTITAFLHTASAFGKLGINCRGSFYCYFNKSGGKLSFTQLIASAVNDSKKDPSTVYNSGDNIACAYFPYNTDAICLFPQGGNLTLEEVRPLADAVIEHNCKTCGSVPIHFFDLRSNDPRWGILTFNFAAAPKCTGNCILVTSAPPSRLEATQF